MSPSIESGKTEKSSASTQATSNYDRKADPAGPSTSTESSQHDGPPVYASDVIAMVKKQKGRSTAVAAASASKRSQASAVPLPDRLEDSELGSLSLPEIPNSVPIQDRPDLILRIAEEAFAKTGSWVVFYREMMAPGGVVHQLYDTAEARRYFETTPQFADLLEMVAAIRSQDDSKAGAHEPERVITVRLPRSMHEATVEEAKELELSINSYCLTKLLQPAGARFTPVESGNRRGRRPGPQITFERVKTRVEESSSKPKPKRKKRNSAEKPSEG